MLSLLQGNHFAYFVLIKVACILIVVVRSILPNLLSSIVGIFSLKNNRWYWFVITSQLLIRLSIIIILGL